MHRTARAIRVTVTVVAALVAVAVASSVHPASAAPAPTVHDARTSTDFTAGVRSIAHGPGVVTVTGTAPVGTSVEVAGDVVEPVWTEADADGRWHAEVRVRVRVGEHVVRVTSAVSGAVVELPVELLLLLPPEMLATVDGIARTIALEGTAHPSAHLVLREGTTDLGETDVRADGTWSATLRGLAFGSHHIEVSQYFDGTRNGGVDDVYEVSGAPVVTAATASRESERIILDGRAPSGADLVFADRAGPVTGEDGEPVRVTAGADDRWHVELPIRDGARFERITVTAHDGDALLGTTTAAVTVPVALTGTVRELPDGSVELAGTGESGGDVALETETGDPVTGADGTPITTTIARSWRIVVPRDVLPADVVVARQRVDGVEQGALHLILPRQPGHPAPGPRPGATGHVSGGTHHSAGAPVGSRIATQSVDRLAYTGADLAGPLGAAGALLLVGLTVLGASRRRARSRADRA